MPVRSSCAIGNGALYVGSSDNHLYAIDALWPAISLEAENPEWHYLNTCFRLEYDLCGLDGLASFYALDAEGGYIVWRFKTGHYVNASPVVVGNSDLSQALTVTSMLWTYVREKLPGSTRRECRSRRHHVSGRWISLVGLMETLQARRDKREPDLEASGRWSTCFVACNCATGSISVRSTIMCMRLQA